MAHLLGRRADRTITRHNTRTGCHQRHTRTSVRTPNTLNRILSRRQGRHTRSSHTSTIRRLRNSRPMQIIQRHVRRTTRQRGRRTYRRRQFTSPRVDFPTRRRHRQRRRRLHDSSTNEHRQHNRLRVSRKRLLASRQRRNNVYRVGRSATSHGGRRQPVIRRRIRPKELFTIHQTLQVRTSNSIVISNIQHSGTSHGRTNRYRRHRRVGRHRQPRRVNGAANRRHHDHITNIIRNFVTSDTTNRNTQPNGTRQGHKGNQNGHQHNSHTRYLNRHRPDRQDSRKRRRAARHRRRHNNSRSYTFTPNTISRHTHQNLHRRHNSTNGNRRRTSAHQIPIVRHRRVGHRMQPRTITRINRGRVRPIR